MSCSNFSLCVCFQIAVLETVNHWINHGNYFIVQYQIIPSVLGIFCEKKEKQNKEKAILSKNTKLPGMRTKSVC